MFRRNTLYATLVGLVLVLANSAAADKYEMVVAQDGSGDFTTIQEAIDATKAFPPQRITIFVKNGTYHEKVRIPSWNNKLSLIGESAENTIITYGDYFSKIDRGRNSTFMTYTLLVEADDFYAENLTIINSAGRVGQAVALHVEGNRCTFKNCRIKGNQDTLYAAGQNSKQYYDSCYIEGTTDFIFGAATAVFNYCTIHNLTNSYITAASTPKSRPFGYVFLNCSLTAEPNVSKAYLGRPWRPYAKVVFMHCNLGKHIAPEGWKEWSNKGNLTTTYYAEYNNSGSGSRMNSRVSWSHELSKKEAKKYTLSRIFSSDMVNDPEDLSWLCKSTLKN
ncbi:pectinesterase family protein [Saccharicrinis sp. FJH54]|uniref:pectinesterase family protein n=1 Tax=Saccharicrinis sp. FJH54 TaxID=3344665 RepID=UPI0035D40B37